MTKTTRLLLALAAGAAALPVATSAGAQQLAHADRAAAHAPTIPSGTSVPVTLDQNVSVKSDNVGNTFDAHVTRDVVVDGQVAIPAGAPAQVKLVQSSDNKDAATLRLMSVQVNGQTRSVATQDARADTQHGGLSTAKRTGVGAAAGAVIGAVTGLGVVKGALVGAGGGLAWGLLDKNRQVDRGTPLMFSLERSVRM
jgi:hypothetical protein